MKKLFFFICVISVVVGCKSPEPRLPELVRSRSFIKESAERNKKLNEVERQKIEALIKRTPDKNFIPSENGFWYHYITKISQDTIKPEFGDFLNFSYSVTGLNGKPIYSETQLGPQSYVMDKEELFTGLRNGLKLMKPTEEVTFIFPSQMAYGYYGDSNKIGINTPLICTVKLNTITKINND